MTNEKNLELLRTLAFLIIDESTPDEKLSLKSIEETEEKVTMLTIKDALKVIDGLSESALRALINQGKIPSFRTGEGKKSRILINKKILIAYFSHKQQ